MNNKRVPPSVAQFAVSERAELLARIAEQAREIDHLLACIHELEMHNHDLIERFAPDEINRAVLDEVARLNASLVQQASVPDGWRLVTTDWLKRIHRDLDACQKLIWANLRGCDPSYYEDAQERLREIDAMLAAPAAPAADAPSVEMVQAACAAFRMDISPMQAMHDALCAALAAHRAQGVV